MLSAITLLMSLGVLELFQRGDCYIWSMIGVGDLSIWEFSGYQPYYIVYDQFVGDVNCIHVVVINTSESRDVQLSQLLHWLHFIAARIRIPQPIGKWSVFSTVHRQRHCQHRHQRMFAVQQLPIKVFKWPKQNDCEVHFSEKNTTVYKRMSI